jgi:hypothetical protein
MEITLNIPGKLTLSISGQVNDNKSYSSAAHEFKYHASCQISKSATNNLLKEPYKRVGQNNPMFTSKYKLTFCKLAHLGSILPVDTRARIFFD